VKDNEKEKFNKCEECGNYYDEEQGFGRHNEQVRKNLCINCEITAGVEGQELTDLFG